MIGGGGFSLNELNSSNWTIELHSLVFEMSLKMRKKTHLSRMGFRIINNWTCPFPF